MNIALLVLLLIFFGCKSKPKQSPLTIDEALNKALLNEPIIDKDRFVWVMPGADHYLTIGCDGKIRLNGKIIARDRVLGKEICMDWDIK